MRLPFHGSYALIASYLAASGVILQSSVSAVQIQSVDAVFNNAFANTVSGNSSSTGPLTLTQLLETPSKEESKPSKEADKPSKEADKPKGGASEPGKEADKPSKEADKPKPHGVDQV